MHNIQYNSFNEIINNIQLKIFEHGHLYAGSEWNFPGVSSPFNRLYFVISGNAFISNECNNIELKAGNMYLVPLNSTFNYICDNELHKFYIHFRIELLSGQDLFEDFKVCSCLRMEPGIVENLISAAESGQINDFINCKGITLSCISGFLIPYADKIKERIKLSSKYSDIFIYIKENCFADLRVKGIAYYFNLSAANLSRNFKNDTGLTLKRYIEDKIVQKAQEKLLITDLPVKDIAFELKFSDEFHFSRFFKNCIGISPNKYRKQNNLFKAPLKN